MNKDFIAATLSNPRRGEVSKIKVRPIIKKDTLFFQFETFQNNQVFHQNLAAHEAAEKLLHLMSHVMKQGDLKTRHSVYFVLVSKKGTVTIKKKRLQEESGTVSMSHNREKRYILLEGMNIPFLQELGVMTKDGKVNRSKFDKFRQINRYLEFIEDILPVFGQKKDIRIIDFGCGKSYLTFAMYYYLHELKGYSVQITGLDLKKEVIEHCNQLSRLFGYENLTFLEGNIADYEGADTVDMVVSLHACDTATDYALAKAVKWDAKVILAVPCCQHELNGQIKNEILEPVLKYGLIKERIAALVTDAMRAERLTEFGYDTQILEFIDMSHTPKNILIRAVKTGKKGKHNSKIKACEEFLAVNPMLGTLLAEKGEI